MRDKHGKVVYEPYRIKVLNTINFSKSMKYNPLAYVRSEKDILKLVKHYFFEYCTKHAHTITVPDETLAVFQSYSWPGNVRELQNVIEYMVICCEGNVLQPSVLADYLGMDSQSIALHPASLKAALDDYERSLIARALEEHGGVRKAAHALGVDPSTISRKAKKYGLEVGEGT